MGLNKGFLRYGIKKKCQTPAQVRPIHVVLIVKHRNYKGSDWRNGLGRNENKTLKVFPPHGIIIGSKFLKE